jgi:hypothetical protein
MSDRRRVKLSINGNPAEREVETRVTLRRLTHRIATLQVSGELAGVHNRPRFA